ncbi:vacuolar protein sorting-associated protein 36 [Mycena leptocephala]|nr:vacuolar protein sorting-associated protein 36 [Mycena leptocephala]
MLGDCGDNIPDMRHWIPIPALLYNDEDLLSSQDGVGIYDGAQKSPNHQSGTVHTDYYTGLFKSSPKVTLHISVAFVASGDSGSSDGPDTPYERWECQVCGYRKPPGLSPAAARRPPRTSSHHTSKSLPDLLPPSDSSGVHRRQPSAIAYLACAFLNHPFLRECEMCATDLPWRPRHLPCTSSHIVKISFRKGGDKAFYGVLRRAFKSKRWAVGVGSNTAAAPGALSATDANRSGITLRVKAKDMARSAADLNERLTALSTTASSSFAGDALVPSTEPEEATFIRSSLSQLGLEMTNAPITLDMMKDERRWMDQLARELAADTRGMMKERGIITLDEVWDGWNRARGVATLLQVIPYLVACTTPTIRMRTFPFRLSVLHTPPYSHVAFAARLSGLLALAGPKTTTEVAREEHVAVGLAAEVIGAVEADGDIRRDDEACATKGGGAEVHFWGNVFHGYVWDGQVRTNEELSY